MGKTTAVKLFAGEFNLFIYLNLEKEEERNIFEGEYPFNELLNRLFLYVGEEKSAGRTLIFIDEIQNSPKTMALLRYFYEEADNLYVIAAGSLLENIMDKNISFPVGRVEFMAMHPCTYQEFLGAMGEEQSLKLYEQGDTPSYAHDKLSALFKKYATIGGMPQVLESYSGKQDYTALNSIYSSLITSYTEDVEKYARSASMTQYIRHIISTAFREAGSRITFEKFGNSPYRSREMKEAFTTLEKTMLLKLVYPVTSTKLPFSPDLKKKPRLHIFDTGLVNYSLGILDERDMETLKEAGVTRYHHNLETSKSYFRQMCTTHTYEERVDTIIAAKKAGLSVCAGAIFGIGETEEQILEAALALRDLDVDSVPINFLVPFEGTKTAESKDLTPLKCLKIISLFRYVLPDKEIIICGGREKNLQELHPLVFYAGANGIMTGDYLTTTGRSLKSDLEMLEKLCLRPRKK